MHKTDLLTIPHWERVMFRSVKLLRGTSMVSIRTCSYRFPDMSPAFATTLWSVSVDRNWHSSLWPHGVRRASKTPVSPSWQKTVLLDALSMTWSLLENWRPWSLDLEDLFSMSALDASSSDLFSIDGRTLYLFSDSTGLSKVCSVAELAELPCLNKGCGDEEEPNLGLGVGGGRGEWEGGRGENGRFSHRSSSSPRLALVTLGLVRPLADFGLITCMSRSGKWNSTSTWL